MRLRSLCPLLLLLAGSSYAAGEESGIDPDAEAAVREMSEFLSRQESLMVRTESTLERLDASGEDQQFGGVGVLAIERPNKLRFERGGRAGALSFFYDGREVVLARPGSKRYATATAPPTLDAMLKSSTVELGVTVPGADLLGRDPYSALMKGTAEGRFVANTELDGVPVRQFAFSGPQKDWQIWIESGERPVPRKLVVGLKEPEASPVNTLELRDWELEPPLDEREFAFQPPEDARRVDLRRQARSAPRR